MFHTYAISVFIWVLLMFHTLCSKCFIRMLHMFSTYVFPRVLDVCCKCFNCFESMLQMFPLDVAKVDLVLHMLQLQQQPAFAAGPACIARGCGGARAAGTGNRAGVDRDRVGTGHGVARDTKRHRTPCEAYVWHERLDASPRSDVRALAFPIFSVSTRFRGVPFVTYTPTDARPASQALRVAPSRPGFDPPRAEL
jgi:hypothetical protein